MEVGIGDKVKRLHTGNDTIYEVCDVVHTEMNTYAVLADNFGNSVDMVGVNTLRRVNVKVVTVEQWLEIE